MAIYFQGAGITGNFFRGAREQAHHFGDLGSLAKKQNKNKEKPPFFLNSSAYGGLASRPPL